MANTPKPQTHFGVTYRSITDMAETLGINTATLQRRLLLHGIEKLDRRGFIATCDKPNIFRRACNRDGVKMGSMTDVVQNLTPQEQEWLVAQTAKGALVALTLAAIVRDAYFEDTA